jgi:hypothetical protein
MSKYAIDWNTVESKGETPTVQLWYPRLEGHAKEIEIELSDVRAADSIRVRYDFERDGWAILQASTFSWDGDDEVCDPDWQEVAFIQAWAREKPDSQSSDTAQNRKVEPK